MHQTSPQYQEDLPYSGEIARKALHISTVLLPVGMYWMGPRVSLIVVATLAAVALAADIARWRYASVERLVQRVFGFMMRGMEASSRETGLVINGATWYLLSLTLLVLVFPFAVALASFIAFALGDAIAALVGRRYGCHTWFRGNSSIEGSIAFFVAGMLVLKLYPGISVWPNVVAVFAGAIVEAAPLGVNDNLVVPPVIALGITLLNG